MILNYLKLMRLENGLIAALGFIISIFIISQSYILNSTSILAAVILCLIVGGGNSLNDYFDYKIDKVNKPNRPIPSGKIKRKNALYFSLFLFFISISLSLLLRTTAIIIVSFVIIILIIYAKYSKCLSFYGNIIVATLVGLIFICAGFVLERMTATIIILSICAALVTLSRELIKDIEDIKGDKQAGALTLPIQIGKVKTKSLAFIFIIPAIILSLYLYFSKFFSIFYLIFILIGNMLLIFSFTLKASKSQKLMKISTIIILLAFLFR